MFSSTEKKDLEIPSKLKKIHPHLRPVFVEPHEENGNKFGDGTHTPLEMTKRSITFDVVDDFVQVTQLLTFHNSHNKILSGDLQFPLEDGVTVTGYGLDVEGKIIDAVPVKKEKADVVFDQIVSKRGEAALAKIDKGNQFTLKVYPMPPKKDRIVKLVFKLKLAGNGFWFPFNVGKSLKDMEIKSNTKFKEVHVQFDKKENLIFGKDLDSISFKEIKSLEKKKIFSSMKIEGFYFKMNDRDEKAIYCEKHPNMGYYYFSFKTEVPKPTKKIKFKEEENCKVTIFYDCSYGRKKNGCNKKKEDEAILSILSKFKNFECTFILFSYKVLEKKIIKSLEEAKKLLSEIIFDGGTFFPKKELFDCESEMILFFTDGLYNFSDYPEQKEIVELKKPIYCFSSTKLVNFKYLKYISNATKGIFFDLRKNPKIEKVILYEPMSLSEIKHKKEEILEVYSSIENNWCKIYGMVSANSQKSEIGLVFGENEIKVTIDIKNSIKTTNTISKLFGNEKIKLLSLSPEKNEEEILSVGREFGIMTENTSFIVLTKLEDFVLYDIEPPKSLKKIRKEYLNKIKEKQQREEDRVKQKLKRVMDNWNNRIKWYETKFPYRDIHLEEFERVNESLNEIMSFKYESEKTKIFKDRAETTKNLINEFVNGIKQKKRRKVLKDYEESKKQINVLLGEFKKFKNEIIEKSKKIQRNLNELEEKIKKYTNFKTITKKNENKTQELKKKILSEIEMSLISKYSEMAKELKIEESEAGYNSFKKTIDEYDFKDFDKIIKEENEVKKIIEEYNTLKSNLKKFEGEKPSKNEKEWNELIQKEKNFVELIEKAIEGYKISKQEGDKIKKTINEKEIKDLINKMEESTIEDSPIMFKRECKKECDKFEGFLYSKDSDCCCYEMCPEERRKNKEDDEEEEEEESADASMKVKKWTPNASYIREIQKKKELNDQYKVYLSQRNNHAASPVFFLNCGDYFMDLDVDIGIKILTNILELGLNETQLFRIVGYRLEQAKKFEYSEFMFRKVLRIAKHEPQSHRDLALVLEKEGKLEESFNLLFKVCHGKWDSRFNEIEQVALVELNHVYNGMKEEEKKKIEKIKYFDKNFIHYMGMDMRISMAWDTDHTDIDLHVHDPLGEHCFYSQKSTTTGGIYTHDFTQGYGPEEFLIKKAPPGSYQIKAKYYASHLQSLTGGTTILLKFFTNYMRKEEKEELVTIRLESNKEMIDVCTMDFF